MRYFLELAYDGGPFHGWQSQPNAVSVQATIENALSTYFQSEIKIVGAGRTDTGVHARQMFAHFDVSGIIAYYKSFLTAINSLVGKSVVINNIREVK